MAQGDDNIPPANVPPHEAALRLRTIIRDMFKSASPTAGQSGPYVSNANSYHAGLSTAHAASREHLRLIENELVALREVAKLRKPSLITKKIDEIRINVERARQHLDVTKSQSERMRSNYQKALGLSAPSAQEGTKETLKMAYSLVQVLPITPAPPGDRSERTIRAMGAIVKAHYGYFEKELKDVPIGGELPIIVTQPPIEVIKEVVVEKVQYVLGEDLPPEPWRIVRNSDEVPIEKIMSAQIGEPSNVIGWIHASEGKGSVENWNEGACSLEDAIETLKRCRWRYNSASNYVLIKGPKRYVVARRNEKLYFTGAAKIEQAKTEAVTSDGVEAPAEFVESFVPGSTIPAPPIVLNMQDVDDPAF